MPTRVEGDSVQDQGRAQYGGLALGGAQPAPVGGTHAQGDPVAGAPQQVVLRWTGLLGLLSDRCTARDEHVRGDPDLRNGVAALRRMR
jgi:hypothetical protein